MTNLYLKDDDEDLVPAGVEQLLAEPKVTDAEKIADLQAQLEDLRELLEDIDFERDWRDNLNLVERVNAVIR